MNLSNAQAASQGWDSGAGGTLGGAANAGPAHPLTVGAAGFGPNWTAEDSMAASIIRLEQENDELRGRVAVLEEEQKILKKERDAAVASETVEEWDHWRTAGECDQWRECAEKLHAAVCYFAPNLLNEEDGFSAEKQAVEEFLRMSQEFAGVIEGGTNTAVSSPSGGHGCPSDLSPRTTLTDEELREEVRHKYEADRVGGHEWGNI
jgi:hypothetical protein